MVFVKACVMMNVAKTLWAEVQQVLSCLRSAAGLMQDVARDVAERKLVLKVFIWIMTLYLASMNSLGQKIFFFFGDGIPTVIDQNIGFAEKLK